MSKNAWLKKVRSIWREDDDVLTFEWTLLVTLVTIGIISGLTTARDAIIDELSDIAQAALLFDQSYTVDEFTTVGCDITLDGFMYTDTPVRVMRCDRADPQTTPTKNAVLDCDQGTLQ